MLFHADFGKKINRRLANQIDSTIAAGKMVIEIRRPTSLNNKSRATITVRVPYNRPKLASGLSLRKLSDNNTFISEIMMMIDPYKTCAVALLKCSATRLVVYGNSDEKNSSSKVRPTVCLSIF